MKKICRFHSLMLLSFLFLLVMVFNKIRFEYDWKNSFWRTVMAPFVGTVWSESFSEENFTRIKVGMQKSEVDLLIGKPLSYDCLEEGCSAYYSKQDTPTADYDRRWIEFDSSGKVVDVIKKFYID